MADEVKNIFKVLIGTIAVIVLASLIYEIYNVSVAGMQVKQMTRMAAKQACVLFTQESYKYLNADDPSKIGGSCAVSDIKKNGVKIISGDFYNEASIGRDATNIWNSMYKNNSSFQNFATRMSNEHASHGSDKSCVGCYYAMDILKRATHNSSGSSLVDAEAETYRTNLYTPENVGIPYFDPTVLNKMFTWELAQILSNCDIDSLQQDENGDWFVNYKGFRVYVMSKIRQNNNNKYNSAIDPYIDPSSFEYKTYDLTVPKQAKEFEKVTGMSVESASSAYGIAGGGQNLTITNAAGQTIRDNNLVTVVGLEYQVKITYQGVTPLKQLTEYVWHRNVKGMRDTATPSKSNSYNYDLTPGTMTGGGIQGSNGDVSITDDDNVIVSGKLLYTLIR